MTRGVIFLLRRDQPRARNAVCPLRGMSVLVVFEMSAKRFELSTFNGLAMKS